MFGIQFIISLHSIGIFGEPFTFEQMQQTRSPRVGFKIKQNQLLIDAMTENYIQEKNEQQNAYFVPFMLAAVYAGIGANMQGVFSLLPIISEDFGITRAQAGLYSSFYFLSATIIAVFSGRFIDYIGDRKGLLFGIGGIGGVMYATAAMPTYGFILIMAFISGVVFSCITPSVSRGIIVHTIPDRRAFSMGIAHSGGGTGGMLAAVLLPLVATVSGWRVAIVFSASFAVIITVLVFIFYPRGEVGMPENENPRENQGGSFKQDVLDLLKVKSFLIVCITGISLGMVMSSIGAHYALYLTIDFELSPVKSGMGLAALQVGGVLGMSGWGLISDKIFDGDRMRSLKCLVSTIAAAAIVHFCVIQFTDAGFPLVMLMALGTGFICLGSMALFFTTVTESAGRGKAGMATGMALIFSRSGVILGPPVYGLISDITGGYAYSWLFVLIVALCFTAILWIYIKRLHTKD